MDNKKGIKLNGELFQKVLCGDKTATTRKGFKDIKLGENYFYDPDNKERGIIDITVTLFKILAWRDVVLNPNLHNLEGYNNPSDFHKAVINIYGKIDSNQRMTVVYFKLNV